MTSLVWLQSGGYSCHQGPDQTCRRQTWACLGSPCLPSPCSTPPQFLSAPLVLILYHPQTRAEGGLVLKKQRKCLYPGKYFALKESLRIIRCEASRRSRNCWQFRNKKLYSVEKIAQPVGPQNLQGGSSSVPSQGLNWTGSVQGEIPWNPPETGCCWGKRWMENTKVTQRGRRWGPCPAKAGRGLSGCLLIYGSKKCHVRSKAQAPVQRSQIFSVKMQIVNILGIAGRIMSSLSFLFLLPHPPLPSFFSSSTYSFYPSKMQNCF